MAQQEEGWPLGLQPMNVRAGLLRNRHFSGSTSFNTLLSGSPSSVSDSSSDLDTESTGSFFHDRSTTLGSLIGVPRINVSLTRRSIRGSSSHRESLGSQKNCRSSKTWYCFSLCPTDTTDADQNVTRNTTTTPSLAHFLEVERRASAANDQHHLMMRRNHLMISSVFYDHQPIREPNSLFLNDSIAPPNRGLELEESSGNGVALGQFPCMCG